MADEQNQEGLPQTDASPVNPDSVVLQPHPPKPTIADHTAQIRKISESLVEEKNIKVGQRKGGTMEVDRKAFVKMVKALAHGYTNMYTGMGAIRVFAQMAGEKSGNYEKEHALYSSFLEEALEP